METQINFRQRLHAAFATYAKRPAIDVDGFAYTYEALAKKAEAISYLVHQGHEEDYTLVLGSRSFDVYAAICGILGAGHAYVPLNPKFPPQRLGAILEATPSRTIIVCDEGVDVFLELVKVLEGYRIIWLAKEERLADLREQNSTLEYSLSCGEKGTLPTLTLDMDRPAYLLFTSGTTGKPKGVMISDKNLSSYLHGFGKLCNIDETDRVSQFFELSFDVSVHDLFMTWVHGACLVVVPEKELMAPARFIQKSEINVWFSVPAVASMMHKLGMLKDGSLSGLRLSMFIGEALPARLVSPWHQAAPASQMWNVYGPTEATIACMSYDCADMPIDEYDVVPIGKPFGETQCRVADVKANAIEDVELGELLVSGDQVCLGYLNNPEKTRQAFICDEAGVVWYRTGDVVKETTSGALEYHGRLDDQVQIRGFRVELSEIEGVVAKAAGHNLVAVVVKNTQLIEAFIQSPESQALRQAVFETARSMLPDYMNPKKVTFIESLPYNANGKIDRNALKNYS